MGLSRICKCQRAAGAFRGSPTPAPLPCTLSCLLSATPTHSQLRAYTATEEVGNCTLSWWNQLLGHWDCCIAGLLILLIYEQPLLLISSLLLSGEQLSVVRELRLACRVMTNGLPERPLQVCRGCLSSGGADKLDLCR